MDEKVCEAAYRLARSYIEWKDVAGKVSKAIEDQDVEQALSDEEVQMRWRRISMAEELFRRHLDGDDGRPCDDCPDLDELSAIPNDVRTFEPSEDT